MNRIVLERKGLLISFCLLYLLFFPLISDADPLDNWHWRNPVPVGSDLTAITVATESSLRWGQEVRF